MSNKPIFVTQPYLPPLEEFFPYLEKIWENKILTNSGPMHQELEQKLSEYLGVEHVILFNNGTNALLTALQVLNLSGEVITTPYSFIATSHSIAWNNLSPVFIDIDENSLNLDPEKIEAAITERTSAIMPVHCYGNPCEVKAIQEIAEKYNLKVIYDAAHAFGVKDKNGSILRHGDLSVLSFHATKVFNTFEGGAIVCSDASIKKRINQLKNFGIVDETSVTDIGINGKMSEINAAFGLLQLQHIDAAMNRRQQIDQQYRSKLRNINGITIVPQANEVSHNHSYFPILIEPEYSLSRDELYQSLKNDGIFTRRYFYPLISEFPMYSGMPSASIENLPISNKIAQKILCLPIYPSITDDEVNSIVAKILTHAQVSA